MKLIVPVRGMECSSLSESCGLEFEKLINELPKFSNDKALIALASGNNSETELKKIKFRFLFDDDLEILEIKKEDGFIFKPLIRCYLIVDMIMDIEFLGVNSCSLFANLYLKRLLLLLNIAYATPITLLPGIIEIKAGKGYTAYIVNALDSAYEHADKMKWPSLQSLGLAGVLNWFKKHNISLHSISNCPSSRAINALSHVFSYDILETDAANLFWCMLGIEALFANGNNGIMEQIRQKLQIVFGEPKEFKRKLNKLYEFRSRLIHGDLDFPAKFSEDVENYEYEYWDYSSFATSLLLASIKKLIINDTDKFEFELIWCNRQTQ